MKIAIGCDHAGFQLKEKLVKYLKKKSMTVNDCGTHSSDSVDYPDFARLVAVMVESKRAEAGILVCGSGNGVAMTANKFPGIRAALCWNEETARLARAHNDANILCLPARFIDEKTAMNEVTVFLSTAFEGGRHQTRVEKISP